MAHHASPKKALRQNVKRKLMNKSRISAMKTFIKKFEQFIESSDVANATAAFRDAQSKIMKAVKKGNLKANTGARKVSRLSAKLKKLSA